MSQEMADYGEKNRSERIYQGKNSYGEGYTTREMQRLPVITFWRLICPTNVVRGAGI